MENKIQKQTAESQLIQLLEAANTTDLIQGQNGVMVRALISDMGRGLTIEKAIEYPKIFQLKKSLGAETVVKILSVVIYSFCHSVKANRSMDEVEIVDCAEGIMIKYSHESVKDIILALKQAKLEGKTFYNSISEPVIYEIIGGYMEKKSAYFEKRTSDDKSIHDGSVRTEGFTLAASAEKANQAREKSLEEKTLKSIQDEKKEMKKIQEFIKKNAKNLE